MLVRLAFWNLKQQSRLDTDRWSNAISIVDRLIDKFGIDILVVVEAGDSDCLQAIADELEDPWSAASTSGKHPLNMGLVFRNDRWDVVSVAFATEPHVAETGYSLRIGREPAALFRLSSKNVGHPFYLGAVHFKALNTPSEAYVRKVLANWLRTELEGVYSEEQLPIIVGGDFNGEPYEPMFGPDGIDAHRRADHAVRSRSTLKFYNPTWRLLPGSESVWDLRLGVATGKLRPSYPPGTFPGDSRYPLIDGVIVSGEWLTDERYVIRDDELTVAVDPLWHHMGDQGAHHSRAEGVKKEEEVTDHLPLVVELELT